MTTLFRSNREKRKEKYYLGLTEKPETVYNIVPHVHADRTLAACRKPPVSN